MGAGFWSTCVSILSLASSNPLIDLAHDIVHLARKYVEYELKLFFINSPCRFRVLLEIIIYFFGELDLWFVHRSFPYIRRNLRRRVFLHRAFSTIQCREDYLSHKLFVLSGSVMKCQLARSFPSLSGDGASLQEDPSCLVYNETHNCSSAPKSSDYPECKLISILLMRTHSTSGQLSRFVSSPETSLGALLQPQARKKICEENCGRHSIKSSALPQSEK